jgi:hypothetical protein
VRAERCSSVSQPGWTGCTHLWVFRLLARVGRRSLPAFFPARKTRTAASSNHIYATRPPVARQNNQAIERANVPVGAFACLLVVVGATAGALVLDGEIQLLSRGRVPVRPACRGLHVTRKGHEQQEHEHAEDLSTADHGVATSCTWEFPTVGGAQQKPLTTRQGVGHVSCSIAPSLRRASLNARDTTLILYGIESETQRWHAVPTGEVPWHPLVRHRSWRYLFRPATPRTDRNPMTT